MYERKREITVEEIQQQIDRLSYIMGKNSEVVFIDTTAADIETCVNQMIAKCNAVMRRNRK